MDLREKFFGTKEKIKKITKKSHSLTISEKKDMEKEKLLIAKRIVEKKAKEKAEKKARIEAIRKEKKESDQISLVPYLAIVSLFCAFLTLIFFVPSKQYAICVVEYVKYCSDEEDNKCVVRCSDEVSRVVESPIKGKKYEGYTPIFPRNYKKNYESVY